MNLIAFWQGLPDPVKESVRRACVSFGLSVQTALAVLLVAASDAGQLGSPGAFAAYIGAHWWAVLIGAILPSAYRAKQGFQASTKGTP